MIQTADKMSTDQLTSSFKWLGLCTQESCATIIRLPSKAGATKAVIVVLASDRGTLACA